MKALGPFPAGAAGAGRILVRGNNWIGDVVLSTPAFRALRTRFPRAEISVLAKPWVIPILRHNPDIDRILLYDAGGRHRGILGVHRLGRDLRRERFDAAFLFQRAFEAAWIARLSRIPVRVGYATDGRGWLLTHAVPATPESLLVPRVEHNLALLQAVGIAPADRGLVLAPGTEDLNRARVRLEALGIAMDDRLFGLSPGATFGSAKRWSAERFACVAEGLSEQEGAKGLVFGGPAERDIGDQVVRRASKANLVNLAGLTDLEEAVALIGLCGLFLTNDSGLMHVAAALDVPLAAIFGPTDPRTTAPWCRRHVLVRKEGVCCSPCLKRDCDRDHRCMSLITVEDVRSALLDLRQRYGWDPVSVRWERLQGGSGRTVPLVSLGR